MRGIIVAVSPEGVIGTHGTLPWHYSGDLKRFKRLTLDSTVIMGRHTWESLPIKPLPRRRNIVITRHRISGVDCYPSIDAALATCIGDVWFIGGARLYQDALEHCDIIDMTHVPDRIEHPSAVYFPALDPEVWEAGPREDHPDAVGLKHQVFKRRRQHR
ncbi:MAG: dihydrofolate reductase [Gammaproteobacteria bacterium]|nr:dihydrofolate reductase [Gammaproteobacteria bacterium]